MRTKRFSTFCAITFLLSSFVAAQTDSSTQTIKAETRLVLLDVVVTDKKGAPITDLTAEEFQVLEDGKPQQIASFSKETVAEPSTAPPRTLPPDVFTNDPSQRGSGPVAILLIDLINTPMEERPRMRTAVLKYLKEDLLKGQRTAIYALADNLIRLQDYTDDPRLLQAAVENSVAGARQTDNKREVSKELQEMRGRAAQMGMGAAMENAIKSFDRFESALQANLMVNRVASTVEAMKAIAAVAAEKPGRKALVWVTASFPIRILNADENKEFSGEVRNAARALTDAQVAVYGVDVRGMVGFDRTQGMQIDAYGGDQLARARAETAAMQHDERSQLDSTQGSIQQLSDSTGGRAFLGRNDIHGAIAAGVADSARAYNLAYYPSNRDLNGKFRKIQVKLVRKGLQLRHRTGYYAVDSGMRLAKRDVLDGVLPSAPNPAGEVHFYVRLTGAPGAAGKIDAAFAVLPSSVQFQDKEGAKSAKLEFHVIAVDAEGKVKTDHRQPAEIKLDAQQFQAAAASGVPFTLRLGFPPGSYRLRLGVRDPATGKVGMVDAPITIRKP